MNVLDAAHLTSSEKEVLCAALDTYITHLDRREAHALRDRQQFVVNEVLWKRHLAMEIRETLQP